MHPLTPVEQRVLTAIENAVTTDGRNPSYRELMQILGYRSTANLHRIIGTLKKKGYIRQKARCWRNIETTSRTTNTGLEISLIGSLTKSRPPQLFTHPKSLAIPSYLGIPGESIYGLSVQDASFLDEHMIPNDLLIVRATPLFDPGDLVLASNDISIIGRCYEEQEAYRFLIGPYAGGSSKQIVAQIETTQIWGLIVGLLRKYDTHE